MMHHAIDRVGFHSNVVKDMDYEDLQFFLRQEYVPCEFFSRQGLVRAAKSQGVVHPERYTYKQLCVKLHRKAEVSGVNDIIVNENEIVKNDVIRTSEDKLMDAVRRYNLNNRK